MFISFAFILPPLVQIRTRSSVCNELVINEKNVQQRSKIRNIREVYYRRIPFQLKKLVGTH